MGFPRMGRQAVRGVTMPELAGGLNLRDSVSMVRDNQLTDGLNVWYKDAVLKTRPGMRVNQGVIDGGRITAFIRTADDAPEKKLLQSDIVPRCNDIYRVIDGKRYCLFAAKVNKLGVDTLLFQFVTDDAVIDLPEYSKEGHIIDNFFVVEQKQTLYCFIRMHGNSDGIVEYTIIQYIDGDAWTELSEKDYYVPLVLVNGDMQHTFAPPSGTMYEGYNLLTHRYRMQFDADTCESERMLYRTLHNIKMPARAHLVGETVTARLTDMDGNVVIHTVTINEQVPSVETELGSDGMRMKVWEETIDFFDASDKAVVLPEKYKGLHNNFEFELPFWDDEHEAGITKVFEMTNCTWFGGQSAGINGGTRLFLCGNREEKEKNLVMWSDLDNPLYFPENNYFYVGNSSQAVTGFGKQNEILVLFKERELFYTYYQQGSEYSAADVISQNVIDVTAAAAYFPLVQIHGSIGCDCPNSIQLCRNRLVWASSEGKVYTLATNSQYSERNVYEVSGMVERRLEQETMEALAGAFSCDWQGLYCLFVDNHVYLMDYNSYGYQYAYSYSKTEDSNLLIPWWYWELPATDEGKSNVHAHTFCIYPSGDGVIIGQIKMIEMETLELGTIRFFYDELYAIQPQQARDELYMHDTQTVPVDWGDAPALLPVQAAEIPCMLQTKIFDFGQPQYNKAVPLVNIAFGNNGGAPVRVTYITENGEYGDASLTLRHNETGAYAPGYVRNVPLRPCVGLSARFGLRLECTGNMAVDSVALNYRITGGAK